MSATTASWRKLAFLIVSLIKNIYTNPAFMILLFLYSYCVFLLSSDTEIWDLHLPAPSASYYIYLSYFMICFIWCFYNFCSVSGVSSEVSILSAECSDGCEEYRAKVLMPTSQAGDDWWRRWNVDNKLQTIEPHSGVRDRYTAISVLKPWLAKNANMLLFHLKTSITPH